MDSFAESAVQGIQNAEVGGGLEPVLSSSTLLKNSIGVLRRGSGRTEGFCYHWGFSVHPETRSIPNNSQQTASIQFTNSFLIASMTSGGWFMIFAPNFCSSSPPA